MPRAFGTSLAVAVAPAPDLAAAVLAGRRVAAAGVRCRRRDAAARHGHLHLAQLRHRLAGGVAMHLRRRHRSRRRRLELRRRIHLKGVNNLFRFFLFRKLLNKNSEADFLII